MAKKKKLNGFQKKQQKEARNKIEVISMGVVEMEKLTELEHMLLSNDIEKLASHGKIEEFHNRNVRLVKDLVRNEKTKSIDPAILILGIDKNKLTYVQAEPYLAVGDDVQSRMRNYNIIGRMAQQAGILPLCICTTIEVWVGTNVQVMPSQDPKREEKIMISSLSLLNESFISMADINRGADGNILPPNFKNIYHDFTDNLSYNFFNGWKESSMKGNVFENQIKH